MCWRKICKDSEVIFGKVWSRTGVNTFKSSRHKYVQNIWEQVISSFHLLLVSMEESVGDKAEKDYIVYSIYTSEKIWIAV